jgi:hypothetical protein
MLECIVRPLRMHDECGVHNQVLLWEGNMWRATSKHIKLLSTATVMVDLINRQDLPCADLTCFLLWNPLRAPFTMNTHSNTQYFIQSKNSTASSGTRDDSMKIDSNDHRISPEVNSEGSKAITGGENNTGAEEPLESSDDSTSEGDEKVSCDLVYEQVST